MMVLVLIIILGTIAALAARYFVVRSTSISTSTSGKSKRMTAGQGASWALVAGLILALLALAAAGRVHWLAPVIGGLMPVLIRLAPQLLRRFRAGQFGADTRESGRTSEVHSAWLRMTLDHDSGHMEGEILIGDHAGKFLSELQGAELMALRAKMQDADSLRLLDAWLDRNDPDWRNSAEGNQERDAQGEPELASGAMTREEALRILGLGEDASEQEIRSAYKQLMQKLHPDLGGSDYLASVVNRAKEILLAGKAG